jgi:putative DNA primase/helicase
MSTPKLGINQLHAWVRTHHQVSEAAMAATFAEYNCECWRYNENEGYWLQWVGTHWAREQTPELLDSLRNFLVTFSKALVRAQIISNADGVKFQSQRTISAVERMCRSLPSFMARSGLFDSDPFLLGTPGGTIDLKTGAMKSANPDDYITVLVPITPAPEGTPLGPRFLKFLGDITGDDNDLILTLQHWFGISAQGTSRDQRILFLYGPGGNGKGVLLRTVAGLLGRHAVNAPDDLLMLEKYSQHKTHLIDTVRARMSMATEVDDESTWDVALVKKLTGGDAITVNRMKQDPFEILVCCTITISGNKKPALKGIDEAVRRRFLVATFKLKVEEKDVIVDLEKEFIAEEGPAILRWIIDGSVAREKAGRLHVAQVILDDTADYFAEENVLQDFIQTRLEVSEEGQNLNWSEKTSNVFNEWRDYCARSGRSAGARNSFTTEMIAAGIKYKRSADGRYFLNVKLKLGWNA